MSIIYALIITSCTANHEECWQRKTYFPTEQECGVASDRVREKLEVLKPKANVIYFCLRQDGQLIEAATPEELEEASASASTALRALGSDHSSALP